MKEGRKEGGIVIIMRCHIYLHMSETHGQCGHTDGARGEEGSPNEKVQRGGKYSTIHTRNRAAATDAACVACRFSAMGREKLLGFGILALGLVNINNILVKIN